MDVTTVAHVDSIKALVTSLLSRLLIQQLRLLIQPSHLMTQLFIMQLQA